MMSNEKKKKKENLFKQCKQYGVPEQILGKIQNMK